MTVEIEVVVQRGMGRGELLKLAHPSKPGHRPFSSSKGQVAILSAVVEMPTDLLAVGISDVSHRCTIGSKSVCDDGFGRAVPLHGFAEEPQSR